MNLDVELYDTTLRDGSQGEGVNFSAADKLRIAEQLDLFGIDIIEGGWPGSNPKDMEFFEQAKRRTFKTAKLAAFSMTRRKGIAVESDDQMRMLLEAETPVIGLEPSCVSVFRDELQNFFPRDERAKRLGSLAMTMTEFIQREGDAFPMPRVERRALVQAHCHHKGVMRFDAEDAVMRKIGLDVEHPDSGCCGMAGAFGFQRDHYELSMRAGERVILPAVREAENETLIIADGFSCREQIAQATGRMPLHIAEVLRMGQKKRPSSIVDRPS